MSMELVVLNQLQHLNSQGIYMENQEIMKNQFYFMKIVYLYMKIIKELGVKKLMKLINL